MLRLPTARERLDADAAFLLVGLWTAGLPSWAPTFDSYIARLGNIATLAPEGRQILYSLLRGREDPDASRYTVEPFSLARDVLGWEHARTEAALAFCVSEGWLAGPVGST